MSQLYLFAAEVDKIQDTLFRTARQRQVLGGSRLLVAFEEEIRALVETFSGETLVAAGGSFRILFSDAHQAQTFQTTLTNAYHALLDTSITIADLQILGARPASLTSDSDEFRVWRQAFRDANSLASQSLRTHKHSGRGRNSPAHSPTIAFCQASGVGLANTWTWDSQVNESEGKPHDKRYLARFAEFMEHAGRPANDSKSEQDLFRRVGTKVDELDESLKTWGWPNNVEALEKYDGERKNVAYLVADGNNMGQLHEWCDDRQLRDLSAALTNALDTATAAPIPLLAKRLKKEQDESKGNVEMLPALPLILGGDDAFVLYPAVYALDVAQHFCLAFEASMQESKIIQELQAENPDLPRPTMSAAVVICKSSYPYRLAHQRGEHLLKQVKRLVKTVGKAGGAWQSAVAFDYIVGSELVAKTAMPGEYKAALGPYWGTTHDTTAQKPPPLNEIALENAIPLGIILEQRLALKKIPAKRRAEIRSLFAPEHLPKNARVRDEQWKKSLQRIMTRLEATQGQWKWKELLVQALQVLGSSNEATQYWREMKREGEKPWWGQGLLELLQMWDYAQHLDYGLEVYREVAE